MDTRFEQSLGCFKMVVVRSGHAGEIETGIDHLIDGIVAECGGACQCGTCHVYVDEMFLPRLNPIEENEDEMLNTTFSPRRPNSRLSCQIPVTKDLDGLIVRTPEAQQ